MSDLLLATTNRGKQQELGRLLTGLPGRVVIPQELRIELDVPEPYDTYAQNATEKADAYCRASGLPALADDSGLEVAVLDWGPGVQTGRYGGADVSDPVGHLLERIAGAPDRRARMVCWLALALPDAGRDGSPSIELFNGVIDGAIATERRGSGGFGFDPIFETAAGVTTAELPDVEKDRISHRGQAVAAALPRLREVLGQR